ncbi:kinase-like domain-containing protein, partial [Roridomyces roridus]
DNAELFKAFSKQARRILSTLVGHLGLLPDALEVSNVRLEKDHPVNRGGFAMIYRGYYESTTESGTQQIQVALKVIPIFGHLSDDEKRRTLEKFSKEALVWRYLKHPNVIPFLGIDSTTFESPQRALVSPWMEQGSVLDFVAKNSPAAQHALELYRDIIEGLRYLHSQNVIHGDLCARNILINDEGRACLSDFGLAAF